MNDRMRLTRRVLAALFVVILLSICYLTLVMR